MSEYEKPEVIADLSAEEIDKLLTRCFFHVGKIYELKDPVLISALCENIWKYYGGFWVSSFEEMFQEAAAGTLGEEIQKMMPHISSRYIALVMKAYKNKRGWTTKPQVKKEVEFKGLTNEEKYKNFIYHTLFYKSIHVNPDWIAILTYLSDTGRILRGEPTGKYYSDMKSAETKVTEWAYLNFEITDVCKYAGTNNKRAGLGELLKKSIGI